MSPQTYVLYIIECQNGSYYTGITNNIERRWLMHCQGKAAKYTRSFPPKKLAACWELNTERGEAQFFESLVKRLTRREKIILVENPSLLTELL